MLVLTAELSSTVRFLELPAVSPLEVRRRLNTGSDAGIACGYVLRALPISIGATRMFEYITLIANRLRCRAIVSEELVQRPDTLTVSKKGSGIRSLLSAPQGEP